MRILFLCNKPPYPPKDGGSLAMNSLIEGLADVGHQVKVLAVNAPKYGVSDRDIPDWYRNKTQLELINVDLDIKPFPALLSLFSIKSYHVKRFFSANYDRRLREILKQEFDIIQVETIFPAVYLDTIRKYSRAKVIIRAHNVEHLIWEQLAGGETNPLKKYFLKHLALTLKKFELSIITKVDGLACITSRESAYFEMKLCSVPIKTIPFGLVIKPEQKDNIITGNTIFHIGSMNWMPNAEGIHWFLYEAWPSIHRQCPGLVFRLAGRKMPDWLLHYSVPGVEVLGEVENADLFIRQNAIMVVPLFSGSGIRIKIIEGMLASKTVITTPKGAEGIDYQHGENILIAQTAKEFEEAIISCLTDPERMKTIGKRAREYVIRHHDLNKIIPELIDFYDDVLI
ncbi:MAG: glycosyltransferase family 4 protein [Bacteroidetes bacterium]|nr:glycosyltransferase family 4 protein [Bacteroidota bacterium]